MTSVMYRVRVATQLVPLGSVLLLFAVACATPPKPAALIAYEDLQRDPKLEEARKHFPDLVGSAEQYGQKADKEWQSNNIDDSTKAASMAEIKLKTALARYEQERGRVRLLGLATEQAKADESLASVEKDLTNINEQIKLMQKTAEAEATKKKLIEQVASEHQRAEDEKQNLSQQLVTEQKRTAAQLALRTAETVEAAKYRAAEYGAATSMLAKADAEMKQGNWGAAQASLEVARAQAEKATELAKPAYEQASQVTQNKARDESLARDAAALPAVSVRLERRGELQRLVIAIQDLFGRLQTTLMAGKDDALDPIARLVNKYPSYPVQIVGHTDNRGRASELIALSQARAQSVFSSLVAKGVEARRLMVSGQGPNEPIADNKIQAGRAKNARIEIIFLYH
jgi:outer membrane protein OmpA-like peptidoglycan-associated protein